MVGGGGGSGAPEEGARAGPGDENRPRAHERLLADLPVHHRRGRDHGVLISPRGLG